MSQSTHRSHGRIVMLYMLSGLVLTVSVAVCVFLVRDIRNPVPIGGISSVHEAERLETNYHRMALLLTILLISSLLILLYVVGAYLVIHAGRVLTGRPIGGKPTSYVDVWGSYRLTDEQISEATTEHRRDEDDGEQPDLPDGSPTDPTPDKPPAEN